MKKVILVTLIAVMAVGLMVSCEDTAVAERKEVDISMAVSLEKTLGSRVDKDIVYWEFMATPKFTLAAGEKIHGIVSYWKNLSAMTTESDGKVKTSCSLGRYTSGDWLFELRALNAQHKVVAIGKTQQIIRDGLTNTINIAVYVDRADGTHGESADETSRTTGVTAVDSSGGNSHTQLEVGGATSPNTEEFGKIQTGFFINQLDATISNISISITRQKVNKDGTLKAAESVTPDDNAWTSYTATQNVPSWYITEVSGTEATIPEGRMFYECTISNLDAGPYIYTFLVNGKDKNNANVTLGGQSLDVLIIGGETTYITGTLLANEYVLAGLKVTAPGMLVGTINGKNYVKIGADNSVKLTYNLDSMQSAETDIQKYYWYYVNPSGEQVNCDNIGAELTFKAPMNGDVPVYGIYRVSCSPTGKLGSIGTATIDVIVNPTEGANVGEFDWTNVEGV